MADGVDSSLLRRLQALRASSATPERPAPSVDVIERAKTPTREDALAARLRRLRDRDELSSPASPSKSPPAAEQHSSPHHGHAPEISPRQGLPDDDDEADAVFRTDDDTLEELLGADLHPQPPGDDEVKALLEELAAAVPKDESQDQASDDSDGEHMAKEMENVIARVQDELELDTSPGQGRPRDASQSRDSHEQEDEEDGQKAGVPAQHREEHESPPPHDLALPSLPSDLPLLPSTTTSPPTTTSPHDIAALRASSSSTSPSFPSVPTSRPSATGGSPAAGPRRLVSRTAYTDDDFDSWCTVCLTDAIVRRRGCDDDPYCSRCWWEMHLGPSAGFDERSHKAVQFTGKSDSEKRKVALGAS